MNKVGAGFGKLKLAVFGNCAPQLLCGTSRGDARELDVPPETFDSDHDQPEAQPPVPGSAPNRLGPDEIPSHSLFHCRVIGQESSFKKNTWKTMLAWGMAVVVLSGAGACRRKAGVEGRFEYTAGWISAELTRAMPPEKAPAEASEVVAVEDAGTGEKQLVRVEIPKKLGGRRVRSVAPKAFRQCTDAVSVKVPSKVSRIGAEAFAGCTELVWAELPSHLERLEDGLFSNCRRMVESVIPKRVGKIGARAYSGCVQLRRVAVPEGVRSVGEQAFSGCASLGSLDLPPGVAVLGQYAFRGCRSLEAFVLPPRLKKLEEGLFADCSGLEKVEIPAGVAELGPRAFKGCASLASVVLPEKLVSIGDGVFADCRSLDYMEFPPGIANIPDGAFEGCRRLRSVKFPPGVTNIGARAFAGCVMLEGIELPAGLQSVGKGAFEGCTGLKQVALPEEVAVLDEGVFADCDALAAISLAPGLERVGREAFLNCRSLAELLLPETVRSVHPRAFAGCSSLGAVEVAEGNPVCCSRDGVLFGDGGAELLHFPCARSGTYIVPEGVKRIGADAFRASNVEGVRVPGSVESIGESAFRDCRSLRRVSLADGLRELGDAAFMGCRSLWELVMPGSVERTGKDLVSGCDGLLMLVVPDNLLLEPPPDGTVPANCTVCSRSEREAARQGKWLEDVHDPFYGLYTGEELDIVSFEGTVLAASAVPEPAKNDYDDCLCAILVELDSLSSQTPASKNVERVVLVNVPIMKEKTLVDQNAFEPGNKISCICTSYDAMPQAIREIQLSDDIQTFEYQQYYPLRIKSIPAFGKTGNRDFAKREITILPVRSLPRDANAAAARRERIQSEIARIESELARHGGSFDAWKEEYKSIAEKYDRLCGEGYSGWIGDSYFTAAGPETTYMTKEYIEGLLPYKKHLENNNIDLIVVRVPSRWDFAARVLGSEDFQENPAWVEHCYECLKNDIEIIDPMPEMWKERFDFPLFYFYHCPEEFHPCEGAAFVVAKETAKILERYPYQKAEPKITLRDFRFETGRAIYFWPAGNEKFDSSENLVFKQALQGGEPLGVVLDSGSPFLFFSASLFWFPQGDRGASIPAYTAYFMQTRTDWFYQRGDFNPRIKHLANSRILDFRRAVVMVGGPENWTTIPPLPRYILDGVRRIALEKTISASSDEIAIDCKDSFSCSVSENGEIHFEPNGRPPEQRAASFDICFEVPYMEGKQACMVRVNTGKISHLLVHLLDDGSDEIIDTNSFLPGNRYGADFFVPLTKPNTTVKIRFQPKNEYGVSLKNIELWYY